MNTRIIRDQSRLLSTELRWMMILRWVAGAAVMVGGMAQWRWLGWYDHGPGFVVLGGVILVGLALGQKDAASVSPGDQPVNDMPAASGEARRTGFVVRAVGRLT